MPRPPYTSRYYRNGVKLSFTAAEHQMIDPTPDLQPFGSDHGRSVLFCFVLFVHFFFLTSLTLLFLTAQANLRKALKENAELAQEYGELQKAVMVARREAVLASSEKNRAEASFHDHTQVKKRNSPAHSL